MGEHAVRPWSNPHERVAVRRGSSFTTIRVHYTCKIPKGKRAEAERALGLHEKGRPASQSVRRGINVEYSAELEEV